MEKGAYTFAKFFLGLTLFYGLFSGIAHIWIGPDIFGVKSYLYWHIAGSVLTLVGQAFLFRDYISKKYQAALWTGLFASLNLICFTIWVSSFLSGNRQTLDYYIPLLIGNLAAGTLYGASLVFSAVSKHRWLKFAGICAMICGTASLIIALWFINSTNTALKADMERINRLISLFANLSNLFFILHFRNEEKLVNQKKEEPKAGFAETWLALAAVTSAVVVSYLAINIATEIYGLDHPSRAAKLLAEPFEARFYVNSKGDTLRYRFRRPVDYDAQRKYPLVVCAHHGGAHGTDNVRQVEGSWAAYLSKEENRKKYPSFLFVPHCPRRVGWGSFPNQPAIDTLIFEAIAELEKTFPVDEKRRYVLGTSGGGYASWHFITAKPTMFAAAIPICGDGNPSLANRIVDGQVAVWAFHGENDKSVPVTASRNMIAAMKRAGGDPRYTEFPGAGHNIGEEIEGTPGVMDWLFRQKRD